MKNKVTKYPHVPHLDFFILPEKSDRASQKISLWVIYEEKSLK